MSVPSNSDSFPTNKKQFEALLHSMDVEPAWWIGTTFRRADVLRFLFLRGAWEIARRASPVAFSRDTVNRELSRAETNPASQPDPAVLLTQRMLDAGISPEEISEFVTRHRLETVHQLLYFLDDPGCVYSRDIAENMRFHLYTEDASEQPVPTSRADWSALCQWLGLLDRKDKPPNAHGPA